MARRASVFLNTLYSVPEPRSDPRRSANAWTLSPRYSVRTVASASASLARISSTTATFSGLAIGLPLAGTDRDVAADTRDAPISARAPRPAGARSRGAAAHYLVETGG